MSKWPLRLKLPDDLPNIAKFSDAINLENASKPVKMYFRDEEIFDDDEKIVIKDANYYKRRKNSKRYEYKKRNDLIIEDSAKSNLGIRFEGKLETNNGFTSIDNKVQEPPFKYVIFQFLKEENEVNVIPVEDIYSFRKHAMKSNESLETIKDRIDQRLIKQKEKAAYFKQIEKSLMSKNNNNDDSNDKNEEYVGGFEADSLFGSKTTNNTNNKQKKNSSTSAFLKSTIKNNNSSNNNGLLDDCGIEIDEIKETENLYKGEFIIIIVFFLGLLFLGFTKI
jgi:hypothetical protein